MKRNPKVSVIMSVFNGGRFLSQAIESVLHQTFADFEFIIVDDASRDDSRKIIGSFNDPRIKLIMNDENLGLARSLNKAIRTAQGQYLARQDADDISLPNRFSTQVRYLDEHPPVAMVGSYVSMVDDKGVEFKRWDMPTDYETLKKEIPHGVCFCHGAVMMRRKIVQELGGYREKFQYTQDLDLWLRIAEKYKVENIGEPLYQFRRSSKSVTMKKLSKQLEFHLLAINLAKERQKLGKDSLAQVEVEQLPKAMCDQFGITRSDINAFKGEMILNYYKESLKKHNLTQALRFWSQGFMVQPQKWKIKALAKDLIEYFN